MRTWLAQTISYMYIRKPPVIAEVKARLTLQPLCRRVILQN
jgi:hypothetical protein